MYFTRIFDNLLSRNIWFKYFNFFFYRNITVYVSLGKQIGLNGIKIAGQEVFMPQRQKSSNTEQFIVNYKTEILRSLLNFTRIFNNLISRNMHLKS